MIKHGNWWRNRHYRSKNMLLIWSPDRGTDKSLINHTLYIISQSNIIGTFQWQQLNTSLSYLRVKGYLIGWASKLESHNHTGSSQNIAIGLAETKSTVAMVHCTLKQISSNQSVNKATITFRHNEKFMQSRSVSCFVFLTAKWFSVSCNSIGL